jgi:hypothetical protein
MMIDFIKRASTGGGISSAEALAFEVAIESRGGTVTKVGAVPTLTELSAGVLTIPFMYMTGPTINVPFSASIDISTAVAEV